MESKINSSLIDKKIIFYGPTGKGLPAYKVGGGERGCQRTIALYEKLGIRVITIEKPNMGYGKLSFLYYSFVTPFKLVGILMKHPKIPVHITGFYENQLFYECVIFMISRLLGHKTIYEIRNGTMAQTFKRHSLLYQIVIRIMIEKSSVVLCQGMEFIDFIKTRWKANTIYYPNYIMNSFLHPYHEQRCN